MTRVPLRIGVWLAIVGAVAGAGLYWAGTDATMNDQQGAVWEIVVPLALAAAVLGVWVVVHQRRGREPRIDAVGVVTEPPSGHTPAEVGWLVGYGVTTPLHVAATLAALADQGVLDVTTATGLLRRHRAEEVDLRPHETVLLDWLFAAAEHTTVDERAASITAAPRTWQRFFDDFSHALDATGADAGLVERTADTEEVLSVGLLSSSVIVAGAIGVARVSPVWLACTAAGGIVLVFADTLARRSPAGARVAAAWQQFCTGLSDADADTIARHAPYALGLNAASAIPLTAEQRLLVDAVERWEAAYSTAAAFLAGPTLAIPRRRRHA